MCKKNRIWNFEGFLQIIIQIPGTRILSKVELLLQYSNDILKQSVSRKNSKLKSSNIIQ